LVSELPQEKTRPVVRDEILEMVRRRPSTAADIGTALHFEPQAVSQALSGLETAGLLHRVEHSGKIYYQIEQKEDNDRSK
jgi:predicted transcriptional regulator